MSASAFSVLAQASMLLSPAAALFQAGYGFAFSQNAVASLRALPPRQGALVFRHIFQTGAVVAIPLSLLSAFASTHLAWRSNRTLYVVAALGSFLPLPYTHFVMLSGIKRLIGISDGKFPEGEAGALMQGWIVHNYIRVSSYLVGGLAGLYAVVFA